MRLPGTLRTWNDARGFGFIAPTHGGAEIFVHISALPNDGSRPTIGEALTYELGRGRNGRPQAVKVIRQVMGAGAAQRAAEKSAPSQATWPLTKIIIIGLLAVLCAYGYRHYKKLVAPHNNPPLTIIESQLTPAPAPSSISRNSAYQASPHAQSAEIKKFPASVIDSIIFRCDGRIHCSQMKSCAEATYFLRNCPGTKMDGDNDGIPCEEQWCN